MSFVSVLILLTLCGLSFCFAILALIVGNDDHAGLAFVVAVLSLILAALVSA